MVRPWRPARPLPKNATAILFGPGLAADELPETPQKGIAHPLENISRPDDRGRQRAGLAQAGRRRCGPKPCASSRRIRAKRAACWGSSAQKVQADRVAALRQLSRRFGNCYVVLKGHHTLRGPRRRRSFHQQLRQSAFWRRAAAAICSAAIWPACWPSPPARKTRSPPSVSPSGSTPPPRMPSSNGAAIGQLRIWRRIWDGVGHDDLPMIGGPRTSHQSKKLWCPLKTMDKATA